MAAPIQGRALLQIDGDMLLAGLVGQGGEMVDLGIDRPDPGGEGRLRHAVGEGRRGVLDGQMGDDQAHALLVLGRLGRILFRRQRLDQPSDIGVALPEAGHIALEAFQRDVADAPRKLPETGGRQTHMQPVETEQRRRVLLGDPQPVEIDTQCQRIEPRSVERHRPVEALLQRRNHLSAQDRRHDEKAAQHIDQHDEDGPEPLSAVTQPRMDGRRFVHRRRIPAISFAINRMACPNSP